MKWFPHVSLHGRSLTSALAALLLSIPLQTSFAIVSSDDESSAVKNLARMNSGAQIECTLPDGHVGKVEAATEQNKSAAPLIMDDDTLSCPLGAGQTTFVVKLPTTSLLDRFSFVNDNAAATGRLKIAVSNNRLPAESPKWTEVDGSINFTHKRVVNLSMLGVEARYVRLSFNVEKPGRIASLALYGGETLERFALREEANQHEITWVSNTIAGRSDMVEDKLNFNFADLYAKAQIVQISSGSTASAKRVRDSEAGYRFSADDPQPTVVVELAENQRPRRVSALYKMQAAGRLDVFLLKEMVTSSRDLKDLKPVASMTDEGEGKAAVDFDAHGARYVALRWTPSPGESGDRRFEIAALSY
jgi:hypothetical protein